MIDKITPRPNESVEKIINEDGIDDLAPVITSMKSYVAPFVNAEETEYLVIEDDFPNGRPALEKGGLIFTDRETVDKVEKMKVCTCLNPLHTALAVYGCLLGYDLISKEMQDPDLKKLVEVIQEPSGRDRYTIDRSLTVLVDLRGQRTRLTYRAYRSCTSKSGTSLPGSQNQPMENQNCGFRAFLFCFIIIEIRTRDAQ